MHEADPGDVFCAYAIAMEHAKAGQTEEAVGWFDETLKLDPSHAYACYHKARLLGEVGRTEEALAAIEAGVRIAEASDDGKAADELAELRRSLGGG